MAKVLHDYKCSEHGYFEGYKPICPMKQCAGEVLVVFLQAPGLVSDKTKKNDKTLKQLAIDFKKFIMYYDITAKKSYNEIYPREFIEWIDSIKIWEQLQL